MLISFCCFYCFLNASNVRAAYIQRVVNQSFQENSSSVDPLTNRLHFFVFLLLFHVFRIYIVDAEGDTPTEAEIELYEPLTFDQFDTECGTFGSSEYAPGDGTFHEPPFHVVLYRRRRIAIFFLDYEPGRPPWLVSCSQHRGTWNSPRGLLCLPSYSQYRSLAQGAKLTLLKGKRHKRWRLHLPPQDFRFWRCEASWFSGAAAAAATA